MMKMIIMGSTEERLFLNIMVFNVCVHGHRCLGKDVEFCCIGSCSLPFYLFYFKKSVIFGIYGIVACFCFECHFVFFDLEVRFVDAKWF